MNMSMSEAASLFDAVEPADADGVRVVATQDSVDDVAPDTLDANVHAAPGHASPPQLAPPDDALLGAFIMRVVDRDQAALAALYDATSAPPGTVKSLIRRSLQQLRRRLESADADAAC